jgi:hypothetical protein
MAKNKKLNLNAIKNASQKQFTTKTITILVDDQEYEVTIDQIFKLTKIEKMVMDFLKSEKVKKLEEVDESVKIAYFMFLILKKFTNVDVPNNLKFEEEINLINSLIDLGIWEEIFKYIPEEQITKVNEFMQKFNLNLNKVIEEMGNEEVIDIVEGNEDIIEESGGQVGE